MTNRLVRENNETSTTRRDGGEEFITPAAQVTGGSEGYILQPEMP